MKTACFTVSEMAFLLKLSVSTIRDRIRFLKLQPEYKLNQTRYFSKSNYEKISEYSSEKKDEIEKYLPFRIETVYHIYESKMNYLDEV